MCHYSHYIWGYFIATVPSIPPPQLDETILRFLLLQGSLFLLLQGSIIFIIMGIPSLSITAILKTLHIDSSVKKTYYNNDF